MKRYICFYIVNVIKIFTEITDRLEHITITLGIA